MKKGLKTGRCLAEQSVSSCLEHVVNIQRVAEAPPVGINLTPDLKANNTLLEVMSHHNEMAERKLRIRANDELKHSFF